MDISELESGMIFRPTPLTGAMLIDLASQRRAESLRTRLLRDSALTAALISPLIKCLYIGADVSCTGAEPQVGRNGPSILSATEIRNYAMSFIFLWIQTFPSILATSDCAHKARLAEIALSK